MGWKQLDITCPKCGEPLHEDTSTGEILCLECSSEEEDNED